MKFKFMKWFKKDKPETDIEAILEEKYIPGKVLGSGGFSIVKLLTRKSDNIDFACKIIDRKSLKDNESLFKREILVLKRLQHPHITSLKDMYVTKAHYYLITDLANGGELFDSLLKKGVFTEQDATQIVKQLLSALDYLHAVGCAHRDLKPENILLKDKSDVFHVMISDFGLAAFTSPDSLLVTSCGTPYYVAPEVLEQSGHGVQCDMWSLGVIVYILLSGCLPFYFEGDDSNAYLFTLIKSGKFSFPDTLWKEVSEQAKDFISKLLVVNPSNRMTAHEALYHPWLETKSSVDVSTNIRKNFNAKKTFKKAVHAIKLVKALSKASSLNKSDVDLPGENTQKRKKKVDFQE